MKNPRVQTGVNILITVAFSGMLFSPLFLPSAAANFGFNLAACLTLLAVGLIMARGAYVLPRRWVVVVLLLALLAFIVLPVFVAPRGEALGYLFAAFGLASLTIYWHEVGRDRSKAAELATGDTRR